MNKSTIIAVVVVVLAAALVASFIWYGSDDDDNGGDSSDLVHDPILSNYINTSTFFTAYKDDAYIDVFELPYELQPKGNVIELRPSNNVTGVSDNGDGTFDFTLSTAPGNVFQLTVELRNVSNLTSEVSGNTVVLTFDASGVVTLIVAANIYGDIYPSGGIAVLNGYDVTGSGWSIYLNGRPIESYTFPCEIPATGNLLEIRADSYITSVYEYPGQTHYIFRSEYERHNFDMRFDVGDSAKLSNLSLDTNTKTISALVDCTYLTITLHSNLS